jgi:hypothetical protein
MADAARKVDLKREFAALYRVARAPSLVQVPSLPFLMLDGKGDPNGSEFQDAVGALYAVAYTLKFDLKKAGRLDWTIGPLEGLWWGTPIGLAPTTPDERARLRWTGMIVQPDEVTAEDVERARTLAASKKDLPALPRLRFEIFDEGLSAQVLHVGPYSEEPMTVRRLHAFIREEGHRPRGRHHEIYLGDPRRTDPRKLRTILRQPVS